MSQSLPTNSHKQRNDPAAIDAAVDYALSVAGAFETWMRNFGPGERRTAPRPFQDVAVLEIGPGKTLGATVLLACGGGSVSAADRFTTRWDPDFHAPFYRALHEAVVTRRPDLDPAPIERLVRAQGFATEVVRYHPYASEELWKIDGRFEVVLSNAVLEHVQDIEVTARNLAAVTQPGGHGFHQVDLRDHRDFSRPLEYLTVSSSDYQQLRERTFCEHGCQWRLSTVAAAFEGAGFRQQSVPNMFADEAYLADVRPRLHPEFGAIADPDLAAISALYVVEREP